MTSSRSDKPRDGSRWSGVNLVESLLIVVILSVLAATAGLSLPVRPGDWDGLSPASAQASDWNDGATAED